MDSSAADLPTEGFVDHAVTSARAAVSAVPVVGGAAAELLSLLQTPYERRVQKWRGSVVALLDQLRADQVTPKQLADDDVWIDALAAASRIAMGTHHEEKLQMLQNVLRRLALDERPSEVIVRRFLRYVDQFQPEHFLVLRYACDPTDWLPDAGPTVGPGGVEYATASSALAQADLGIADAEVVDLVAADLGKEGLVNMSEFGIQPVAETWSRPWVTDRGRELLAWVEAFE